MTIVTTRPRHPLHPRHPAAPSAPDPLLHRTYASPHLSMVITIDRWSDTTFILIFTPFHYPSTTLPLNPTPPTHWDYAGPHQTTRSIVPSRVVWSLSDVIGLRRVSVSPCSPLSQRAVRVMCGVMQPVVPTDCMTLARARHVMRVMVGKGRDGPVDRVGGKGTYPPLGG